MSRQLPLNQVRLTNVAVVRLSRAGHRFEIACYRNKILNYRQGTETDLSEVLQTERVFANVSKGQFANNKLLQQCFDTTDELEVCRFILDRGDVQISDQERAAQHESTLREVASMISEKCVHPGSRRPYTMAQVRDAMRRAGFMVHPTHNVKQQFLDCVKLLQKTQTLEIERAKMQLALVLLRVEEDEEEDDDDDDDGHDDADIIGSSSSVHLVARRRRSINNIIDLLVKEGIATRSDIILLPPNNNREQQTTRIVFQSDPSFYRKIEIIARDPSVRGRLEIIQQCVTMTEDGEVTLGSELERRAQQKQQQQQQQQHNGELMNTMMSSPSSSTMDENIDGAALSDKLQSNLTIDNNSKEEEEEEDNNELQTTTTTHNMNNNNPRKVQKAAQKKSKKAKRREKEEQTERGERIAAEKNRQRERAERLGIIVEGGDDGLNNNIAHPSPTTTASSIESNNNNIHLGGGKVVVGSQTNDVKPCNTCGGAFTPGEYRLHFRSDWHRYNVKLKMKNVPPVSEREFLLCDSDAFFE